MAFNRTFASRSMTGDNSGNSNQKIYRKQRMNREYRALQTKIAKKMNLYLAINNLIRWERQKHEL